MDFELKSAFQPTGDQPEAIRQLTEGINNGDKHQTLLGVTGSGKTFTVANVIKEVNKPTLVLSHNKTLAAQLYAEFKEFFPNNAVEYFVSYYDYYQPEAYLPVTDTYIEKDLSINEEIEKLRLRATSALLSGRRDVIVVSSVSCIYGIGNPEDFNQGVIHLEKGQNLVRNKFLHKLVENMYSRAGNDFTRSTFRVKGDTVDVYLAYMEVAVRIVFWGNEIEEIYTIDPINNNKIEDYDRYQIYPANIFVTSQDSVTRAIEEIQDDLVKQVDYFNEIGKQAEAKRLLENNE